MTEIVSYWRGTVKLRYSGADSHRTAGRIVTILAGIFLGAAFFSAFLSAFNIRWSASKSIEGNPINGFVNVWNGIADTLGRNNFIILEKYSVHGSATGMFLTLFMVIMIAISVLVMRSGIKALLLIYAAPFIVSAFYGIVPGVWQSGLLTLALIMALIGMNKGDKTGVSLFTGIIIAAVVSLAVTVLLTTTVTLAEPLHLQKAGESVVSAVEHLRYGDSLLANGKLNSLNGRKTGTSSTALQVTMKKPQSMYLRGYIGEIYEGNKWERLSTQTCYSQRDSLYWLNKSGFSGMAQLSEASEAAGIRNSENQVKITVNAADRSNMYLPYELKDTVLKGAKSRADSYLQPTGIAGGRSYSFTATGNITDCWTDNVSRLYSHKKTEAINRYFINESNYNVFVYQHYTGLSNRMKLLIHKEIGSSGGQKNHVDYKIAINNIKKYLKDNYVYSKNFSSISENDDFAENFIKMHKGCDVHYATLATLMFRYYGIPARYVEGYLITPGDVKGKATGATVSVAENRIHAWTEIYVDGFGWVPIEVTPQYYGVMKEADISRGLTSVNYENQFKTQKQKVTGKQKTKETSEKNSSRLLKFIAEIAGAALLALILIWLLYLILKRTIALVKRHRIFYGRDPKRAVCAIYGYMLGNDIPVSLEADRTGNYAAYSDKTVERPMQELMLRELKKGKHEKAENKKKSGSSSAHRCLAYLHRLRRQGGRKKPK